jgi:uncharacterized membrane protein YdfJ with MMPL/SSD domain/pSer/pThr/pTyr-binding forkhead associated (FHA) protein
VIGREAEGSGALSGDSQLSRRHARVTETAGRLVIEDLGSTNGTLVNGRRIEAATELRNGDSVAVGGSTLEVDGIREPQVTAARPAPDVTAARPRPGAVSPPSLKAVAGPAEGTVIPLAGDELVIGREAKGPGALSGDSELSRRHARVSETAGRLVIEDLGSTNGTFVNGRRIEAPTDLSPRDTIELGATTLRVEAARGVSVTALRPAEPDVTAARPVAEPAAPAQPPPAHRTPAAGVALRVVAGMAAGATIPLGGEPVVLGRAEAGEGTLGGDPELSRRHVQISMADGRVMIEDLGSANGTFVNGRRIPAPTLVEPGDAIWVGTSTLVVTTPDAPAPEVPPAEPPPPSVESGLLSRFAEVSHRYPKRILAIVGVFFVIAVAIGAPVTGLLQAADPFNDSGAESVKTNERIAAATGEEPGAQMIALVTSGQTVGAATTRKQVKDLAAKIRKQPKVNRVATFYATRSKALVSRDRRQTYVAVFLEHGPDSDLEDAAIAIQKKVEDKPRVIVGGPSIAGAELGDQVGEDIGKAEGLAFPILFVLSLFVFRGVVAALMPLFVGALTVFTTFFVLRWINEIVPMSVFALNIVIALGLGLAIDYSLFVVSRYREELAKVGKGRRGLGAYGAVANSEAGDTFAGTESEALRRTLYTAGRTILYSSITVAIALATLCVFPQPFLYSMGIGGAVTALLAVTVTLIALPALLAVLGPRINAGAPKRWRDAAERTARQGDEGPWYRLAHAIMRRPGRVAAISAAFLILLGIPALGIKFTGVDASSIPKDLSSRKVDDALSKNFSVNPSNQITVLAEAPRTERKRVNSLATKLRGLPGAEKSGASPQPLKGKLWTFDVLPSGAALDDRTLDLTKRIRATDRPFPVTASGATAAFIDEKAKISSLLPMVGIILCATTALVLFLMTGSVILPIKSLLMNALSLSAAFGLLVLIFQKGNLEGVLGFQSQGAIELSQPVLLFAVAFGLATDYAVFLLTRIREARMAGASETDSVAIGLERTGRIVTQAALLFCVAIGAFATSSVIFIKEVGVGTALAVIIDATIIRAFLVPSLMALLGARNWWAPRPLRWLHNKVGLSEG